MELTKNQKTFLLETFFKNENYPGWGSIAESLLTKGECIVAGDRCIWLGGVGNFIQTEKAEGLFGCLKYTFNSEQFFNSLYYQVAKRNYLNDLNVKKQKLIDQCNEMEKLP